MITFSAHAKEWKRFFQLSTFNFELTQVAVDIGDWMFVSSYREQLCNAWVVHESTNFDIEGTGTIVLNIEDIQRVLKRFKDMEYRGTVEGNTLYIQGEGGHPNHEIGLGSLEDHRQLGGYVEPKAHLDEQRLHCTLHNVDNRRIPAAPPNPDTDYTGPYQQILGVASAEIKELVKAMKDFNTNEVRLMTTNESLEFVVRKGHAVSREELETSGDMTVSYDEEFDEPLSTVLSLAAEAEDCVMAFTDHREPIQDPITGEIGYGSTAGLWLSLRSEGMHTGYYLNVLRKTE